MAAFSVQYATFTAATVCTAASRNSSSELSRLRFATTYWRRAASIGRSFSSGCENAAWMPDCRLGSKLLNGSVLVVRAVSHDTLHAPPPHGTRWRTPVDENQSLTSMPASPSSALDGGVVVRVRPPAVEKTGTNAPRLSPTRAAPTAVSSRTIDRSAL